MLVSGCNIDVAGQDQRQGHAEVTWLLWGCWGGFEQGWEGRGGARGAGRQKAAPPAGARGAAKFGGAEIQNSCKILWYQTSIYKFTTARHCPRKDVDICIRRMKECIQTVINTNAKILKYILLKNLTTRILLHDKLKATVAYVAFMKAYAKVQFSKVVDIAEDREFWRKGKLLLSSKSVVLS